MHQQIWDILQKAVQLQKSEQGSAADLKASEVLGLGLSLLSGNLINGTCVLTTGTTPKADAICMPIMTPMSCTS